jgi:general secretion pathway protein M
MSAAAESIQSLRQAWQAKWATMAPRERQIATVAGWLILLTIVVLVAVRPAWRVVSQSPAEIREVDAQLDDMRRLADEAQALRQRPPVPPAQSEAALKSATERLGPGARLQMLGDRATLNLTKVAGEALATWLEEARGAARVKPIEAGLMQVQPGVYSGTITVMLPPGSGGGR